MDWKTILLVVLSVIIIILTFILVQKMRQFDHINDDTFGINESLIPTLNDTVERIILIRRPISLTPWLKSFWANHFAILCVTRTNYVILDVGFNFSIVLYETIPLSNNQWKDVKENKVYTEVRAYDLKDNDTTLMNIVTEGRKMHHDKTVPYDMLHKNCQHEMADIIRMFCVYDENDPNLKPPSGMSLLSKIITNRI